MQINMNELLEQMKIKMKEHPVTKQYLDRMLADGVEEDVALDIMIQAWLNKEGRE